MMTGQRAKCDQTKGEKWVVLKKTLVQDLRMVVYSMAAGLHKGRTYWYDPQ